MRDTESDGAATRAIHAGSPPPRPGEPVVPPIVQSATFHWASPSDDVELRYSRYGNNPNQQILSAKIASLEGTEAGLALGSGMGAIAMTLLSLTEAGDRVVASHQLYGATLELLRTELPRRGITTTFVDPAEPSSWAGAVTDRTRVLLVEVPTNPTLRVYDLAPIRAAADQVGARVVADVTFASPVNLRASGHGVDVTVHSATKYLGGHSDLIAGVVAGSTELVSGVAALMKLYGPALDPHAAWLLDRGLKTLPLRMARHNESGMAIARWLAARPEVASVIYPGLPDHPDHDVASRLLDGFGGMVSMVLRDGGDAADQFMSRLSLAIPAPSLGGVETLVSQPRYTSHAGMDAAQRAAAGIPDGFVRISVGLEEVEDLQRDFAGALGG